MSQPVQCPIGTRGASYFTGALARLRSMKLNRCDERPTCQAPWNFNGPSAMVSHRLMGRRLGRVADELPTLLNAVFGERDDPFA